AASVDRVWRDRRCVRPHRTRWIEAGSDGLYARHGTQTTKGRPPGPSWRGTGGGYVPVAASGRSPEHPCSRRWRASLRASRLGSAGLRGGPARGGAGAGRLGRARCGDDDAIAVLLDRAQADALHLGQLLGTLERPVGLAVGDDRLGLGRADVVQHAIERGRVGGIDVDLLGGQRAARQQQRQRQRRKQGLDLVHVYLLQMKWVSLPQARSSQPALAVLRVVAPDGIAAGAAAAQGYAAAPRGKPPARPAR